MKHFIFGTPDKKQSPSQLVPADGESVFRKNSNESLAAQLGIALQELAHRENEKKERAAELVIAKNELFFQNDQKDKRAAELFNALVELTFQNNEKESRAAELVLANKELVFQNGEKNKRAAELIIANKELVLQSREKQNRATELIAANKELVLENRKKEQRAEELLVANIQKAEAEKYRLFIEEKNRSITDSINYAKLIQQAKLPRKEDILATLKDSFVLFKPKDIVSGDFYYFHKKENEVYIAAADCTGHGVPGAFMSLICSEKVSDAVSASGCVSEILKQLNVSVKASLRQSENSMPIRDGMDIALCCVDIQKRKVIYAGANRPIWIIRKGGSEVEEIKATKKAIGGFTEDDQYFERHELSLGEGDTFYIFSDGYADTFGGQAGKKLTTREFKQVLLRIQDLSLQQQEKYLNNFIECWKKEVGQVDDILVIGVRL